MLLSKPNWNPSPAELRKFSAVILIGFALIGWALARKDHPLAAQWIWGISGTIGLVGLAFPTTVKPFYWLWMGLGFAIGSVTSRIALAMIFYGILTPIAVVFRWKASGCVAAKTFTGGHDVLGTSSEH